MDFFEQKLLTPREAARYFGVSIGTIRNWMRDGTIYAKKVGGRWRIPQEQQPARHAGGTRRADARAELVKIYGF
jgi:excisionase family DNA binding protein